MSVSKRLFFIGCIVSASVIGSGGGYYLFLSRKEYVTKKKKERKRAYRGSSTMRRDAGKRVGKTMDAWKDQFKK